MDSIHGNVYHTNQKFRIVAWFRENEQMLEAKENRTRPLPTRSPPPRISRWKSIFLARRSEILYKISAREISGNICISRTNPSEYGTSIRNIFGFYDARTMRSILNNAIIARAKSIRDSRPLHSLFHRVHREIILLILFLCVFFFAFPKD